MYYAGILAPILIMAGQLCLTFVVRAQLVGNYEFTGEFENLGARGDFHCSDIWTHWDGAK